MPRIRSGGVVLSPKNPVTRAAGTGRYTDTVLHRDGRFGEGPNPQNHPLVAVRAVLASSHPFPHTLRAESLNYLWISRFLTGTGSSRDDYNYSYIYHIVIGIDRSIDKRGVVLVY